MNWVCRQIYNQNGHSTYLGVSKAGISLANTTRITVTAIPQIKQIHKDLYATYFAVWTLPAPNEMAQRITHPSAIALMT